MASGIPLLLTLLVMIAALGLYRVVLLIYFRRKRATYDTSQIEQNLRLWWRYGLPYRYSNGAASIISWGVLAMFVYVVSVGADLLSPIGDSIQLGLIYAILGIGLTLTYAVVKLPNFAHGEMATAGAYAMALSQSVWSYPAPLAFAVAAGAGAGLGLIQHMLVYRPLIIRRARMVQIMIASFALSLTLRSIFWMFAAYGNITSFHPISTRVLTQITIPFTRFVIYDCTGSVTKDCRIGTSAVTDLFFSLLVVTVPLVILMHLLLTRTLVGKSMRAIADNIELSQVTGINVENIRRITWLLTGALAGLGGAFLGIAFPIGPELGWTSLLRVFAAVTLGGLVSFYGTIAGGLIVGFGEYWVTIIGATNFGLSTSWQPFTVFLIIVLVLLIRPAGLSGLTSPELYLSNARNYLRQHIRRRAKRKEAVIQNVRS